MPSRVRELERWETMLEPMGLPSTPPMRHHIGYDRAFERGQWVGQAFPGGGAHREIGAIAERVLAELGLAAQVAAATPDPVSRPAAPEPAVAKPVQQPLPPPPATRGGRAPTLAEGPARYVSQAAPAQSRRRPPPRLSWLQRWFGD